MTLTKIHIENFGKLHDFTVALNSKLNELYYENGFGKTTLARFIKAMFYGMPPARENIKMDRKKYMPWQGGNFGGYIEFEQEENHYRLTRIFGKTPESDSFELINLITNKIVDLKGRELGEVLFGVGRDTFEMTAFFPQLNFSVASNEQISANILGLDKFKFDLANLNTAIIQIKKKITELKKDKPSKDELILIKRNIQDAQNEILQLENRFCDIDKQIGCQRKVILDLERDVQKGKEIFDFEKQKFDEKQRLKIELLNCQEQLNELLSKLNNFTIQKRETLQKSRTLRFATFVLMMVLGSVVAVLGIILPTYKIMPIWTMIIFLLPSLIIFGLSIVFYIFSKKKEGNGLQRLQIVEIENKINLQNQQMDAIKRRLNIYENVDGPIMNDVEQLNLLLYQEKLREQTLIYEKDKIGEKIELLNDELDNLNNKLLNKEELLLSAEKKIELLTKAKDFLIQANENVSSRFIGPANRAIKEILTKFDIRNREFIVDTNFNIKEITPVGIKEEEYSSQGYQDILAFCVRIYFLKEIYKQEKPFIILDDTFVNLDDENLNRARAIVKELERHYQIIYTCCNSRCKMK